MVETELELLQFFKALSDATRLRIAGRLAEGDCSAEALAEWLGDKPAVVRHHLGRLAAAGLAEGPNASRQTYRLRLEGARALAGRLLAHEVTPVPEGVAANAFEHKVLREFLTPDGAIRDFPAQERKFIVILRYSLQAFETGQRYSEKEVNQRQTTGQAYWRA